MSTEATRLADEEVKALEHEEKSRNDTCYRCDEQGHIIAQCDLSEDDETDYGSEDETDNDLIEICGRYERDIYGHQGGYCSYRSNRDDVNVGYKKPI